MSVIGLDVGGTKLAFALFSGAGEVLERDVAPVGGRTGGAVGALVLAGIRRLLDGRAAGASPVEAIGVAVPGIYHSERGRVWAPNIPGWDDYPLPEEIRAGVGAGIEVRVDSDRACCILGESWQGTARGCRNAIFVAVGTGIGAGILIDGRVLRGHRDIAGAIGWLALDRPYRPEYRGRGCFEHHASGPGLVRVARELLEDAPAYRGALRERDPAELATADVFLAADAGDDLACRVIDRAIGLWGMAVANLASLFDPEMIVFGGGIFGPAARYLERIREEALLWAQPISMPRVRLGASSLGGDAGLYGAGRLALGAGEIPTYSQG